MYLYGRIMKTMQRQDGKKRGSQDAEAGKTAELTKGQEGVI